jgi:N-glycosidase YbiA
MERLTTAALTALFTPRRIMTIYFYKADQPYGCFSNFSAHSVELAGRSWPTAEHYYQAHKFFGSDRDLFERIHAAPTPEAAAKLGRSHVQAYRPDWDQIKLCVMTDVVRNKFQRHREIQHILIATGDRLLVEDSPVDYFWGCGADRSGTNHLGQILMRVRTELRQVSASRSRLSPETHSVSHRDPSPEGTQLP